jgi:hypothetical protein
MTDQPTDSHQIPVTGTREPYEPEETPDGWFDEPAELPRRPRRRLLTPLPVALLCLLLTACGFIGGVLVEKGQGGTAGTSGSGTSGLAGRFAALRSAAGRSGAGLGAGTGAAGSGPAGAGAPTTGQVAFVQGSTLYVTDSSGNTIKVKTSAASTVTKTVGGTVRAIRPGEEVVISGTTATNGTVTAESIRVGGGAASGLAGLFGGGAGTSTGSSTGSSASPTNPTSSGGPALFGGG